LAVAVAEEGVVRFVYQVFPLPLPEVVVVELTIVRVVMVEDLRLNIPLPATPSIYTDLVVLN
jgi:hypothetical protein